jgi:hypothetical protein
MEGDETWLSVVDERSKSEIAQFHFDSSDPRMHHNHSQISELIYALVGEGQDIRKLGLP